MLIYYYGNGKGKTTAALGAVLRAAGYGWQCLVLQAIKGQRVSGEKQSIGKHLSRKIEIRTLGQGFIGIQNDNKPIGQHQAAARKALREARQAVNRGQHRLIVLDEYGDLPRLRRSYLKQILSIAADAKEKNIHLIITGHLKQASLVNAADLVTKMANIKHPYECGIMAIKGIDY